MNCWVYRCRCIYLGYLYHCAPYYFSTGQIIPYQLHQVATTSTVSEAHRVLPMPRFGGNWKNPWEKKNKKKSRECFHFAVDISFQRKTGQKMDYISFQQLFEHLTTNQIDFRSSKSTIQLKLTWKTEPFSAVRNAKPGSQPSHARIKKSVQHLKGWATLTNTCDVKMMLRIGIWQRH